MEKWFHNKTIDKMEGNNSMEPLKRKAVHGVIPPIITPLDEKERVDEEGFRKLLRYCVDGGLHGIFVAGSNGETMALTQEERNHAIRIAIDEAGKDVPVICGVMDSSTKRVIDNIKALEQMGGQYAVITPVFYARHATQDETVRHFEEISRETNISLVIYNIPPFTSQTLTPETIFRIAEIDKVVGYKDSSGRMGDFMKCLKHFRGRDDFFLMQGSTPLSAASMLLGADGYVPSLAPAFPLPFVRMYEAGARGDIEATIAWNDVLMETDKIYPMAKNQTASTKYAIARHGFTDKRVAMPSEPITEAEMAKIDAQIERVLAMIDETEQKWGNR